MTGVLRKMKAWLFAEDGDSFDSQVYEPEADPGPRRRSRLIPIHSRSGEIFIRRPRNQEDAQICVDCLRGRRAVVINLKDVPAEDALRVFDFMSGATYALGGHAEQAGENVYLLTPQSIGIMAEEEAGAAPRSEAWQEI